MIHHRLQLDIDDDDMCYVVLDLIGGILKDSAYGKYSKASLQRTKRRVFWQTLQEIASHELKLAQEAVAVTPETEERSEPIYAVLGSISIQTEIDILTNKWLPLHFAASLPSVDREDFEILSNIINQQLEPQKYPTPSHIFAMARNPTREMIDRMRQCHSLEFSPDSPTPLHLAAEHSSSLEMIEVLLNIYPQALSTPDDLGYLPIHRVAKNTTAAASSILRRLVSAAPDTVKTITVGNELPIHYFLRLCKNRSQVHEMISIFLEAYRESINSANDDGYLPIHVAAECSSFEVFKMIAEANMVNLTALNPGGISVAHIAAAESKIEIIHYIHSFAPELFVGQYEIGFTPLHSAVDANCRSAILQVIYSYAPITAKWVDDEGSNLLHLFFSHYSILDLENPMSDDFVVLKFLLRVVPLAASSVDDAQETPYSILTNAENPAYDYARRLMLLASDSSFQPGDRKELNYRARKEGLFAFLAPSIEPNIFSRIRQGRAGQHLMRIIIGFL